MSPSTPETRYFDTPAFVQHLARFIDRPTGLHSSMSTTDLNATGLRYVFTQRSCTCQCYIATALRWLIEVAAPAVHSGRCGDCLLRTAYGTNMNALFDPIDMLLRSRTLERRGGAFLGTHSSPRM